MRRGAKKAGGSGRFGGGGAMAKAGKLFHTTGAAVGCAQ
jgi:hypothetical protein